MEFINGEIAVNQQIKGLPRLKLNEALITDYLGSNPFKPLYPVHDKSSFLGIEVEVENVRHYGENSPFWMITEDGSLRNRGREFISVPTRAQHVEQALKSLFNDLNSDIDFSERTSIHVHLNIRTLNPKQLGALALSYLVFEGALFNWVGKGRDENIFCSPLRYIDNLGLLPAALTNVKVSVPWQKYTALNFAPIWEKGTIEFRHLYGTSDIKTLMFWINCILALKIYALKTPLEQVIERIRTLNTTSQYDTFGHEIFGEAIQTLARYPNFAKDCAEGICAIKEQVLPDPHRAKLTSFSEGTPFYKHYLTLQSLLGARRTGEGRERAIWGTRERPIRTGTQPVRVRWDGEVEVAPQMAGTATTGTAGTLFAPTPIELEQFLGRRR